jgi:hypothetical protein
MSQFLFVTDLDNTFVGDDEALTVLQYQLNQHRQQHGTKIVYATGRSPTLYKQLKEEKALLDPDALVTSVGTEIYFKGDIADEKWSAILSDGWDREVITTIGQQFSELEPQPESEQRPFKVSYFVTSLAESLILELEATLKKAGLKTKIVYSDGKNIDVLPEKGNKGLAMQFLAQRWAIAPDRTVACGDSGNDIDLFRVGEEHGIIVGNAQPELVAWYTANLSPTLYFAKNPCAKGILEGLEHFSFF